MDILGRVRRWLRLETRAAIVPVQAKSGHSQPGFNRRGFFQTLTAGAAVAAVAESLPAAPTPALPAILPPPHAYFEWRGTNMVPVIPCPPMSEELRRIYTTPY